MTKCIRKARIKGEKHWATFENCTLVSAAHSMAEWLERDDVEVEVAEADGGRIHTFRFQKVVTYRCINLPAPTSVRQECS